MHDFGGQHLQRRRVVARGCGRATAPDLRALGVEECGLDLRAAQVDAQAERGRGHGGFQIGFQIGSQIAGQISRQMGFVRSFSHASAAPLTRGDSRVRTIAW